MLVIWYACYIIRRWTLNLFKFIFKKTYIYKNVYIPIEKLKYSNILIIVYEHSLAWNLINLF